MSHPRTSTSLPANGVGSPVTVDGIKYVWNTVTGRWETEISKNINIVTKDVDISYQVNSKVIFFKDKKNKIKWPPGIEPRWP
mgnify:CR=1 FL=1